MQYLDREGHKKGKDSKQDLLLRKLYANAAGRILMKPLVNPVVSEISGKLLDSPASKCLIAPFVKANQIDLSQCKKQKFDSYNDFFTRKLKEGAREIAKEEESFISPCDGKLTVYPICEDSRFLIKNTLYTTEELLKNRKLAERYRGGYAWIFRLSVEDYHRYCYVADGYKSENIRIPGIFHTVNPTANDVCPIYKQNTREYSLLKTKEFGTVLMMEVGALMVGKIENHHGKCNVRRGEEKGNFAFGGSTIILLTQKGKVLPDTDISEHTKQGYETAVILGEKVGSACQRG